MSDMTVATPAGVVICFSVSAEPNPGLVARVLELFAKRGLMPSRFLAQVEPLPTPRLALDIQATGLAPDVAAHMALSMEQLFGVAHVSMVDRDGQQA